MFEKPIVRSFPYDTITMPFSVHFGGYLSGNSFLNGVPTVRALTEFLDSCAVADNMSSIIDMKLLLARC